MAVSDLRASSVASQSDTFCCNALKLSVSISFFAFVSASCVFSRLSLRVFCIDSHFSLFCAVSRLASNNLSSLPISSRFASVSALCSGVIACSFFSGSAASISFLYMLLVKSWTFIPISEYCSVLVIFSRMAAFSSLLHFRKRVNSPCASMVVRQNWSKVRPIAARMASIISLSFPIPLMLLTPLPGCGEASGWVRFCNVQVRSSFILLRSTCHSASYSFPSLPRNHSRE